MCWAFSTTVHLIVQKLYTWQLLVKKVYILLSLIYLSIILTKVGQRHLPSSSLFWPQTYWILITGAADKTESIITWLLLITHTHFHQTMGQSLVVSGGLHFKDLLHQADKLNINHNVKPLLGMYLNYLPSADNTLRLMTLLTMIGRDTFKMFERTCKNVGKFLMLARCHTSVRTVN